VGRWDRSLFIRATTQWLTDYLYGHAYMHMITAKQNERLREWLGENGVWMTDRSGWGVPPHPLGGSQVSSCISF
jgi:hypothetical protein